MDLKNYTSIITNLSIVITFIYSIILIIDELYNIGLFSFKYTYLYNYGTFTSEFNNIQTIECETNRFNLYSNDIYLYKDIFSKSYFNYLIIIAITFITILFVLAYGINFYFTFIINQPEVCSFYKSTSFIKIIMKCLCDTCHEYIPDCTGNYFISFIIIIIIPLSYFLKSFLNIDITPNSTSVLFSFGYIILFIILLFTYSFILFNINQTDNNTNERLKDVGIYLFFTIIFILSAYIYKYIYNKYTDLTLNKNKNPETFYDIYKQIPPIKPRPISEPIYKGVKLLNSGFKYDPKNMDIDYKNKKEIMDDYYISIKNYDKDMNYYAQKYNNYINSKSKLGDSTNFINIIINILGLNNYIHIYIIALLIFASGIYYFYNNDLLFICVIYLICILTILTIINAILYYNTILNKYIIYEPQSYYKNDITNTNTKLNLLLDPSNGDGFYNILTNNQLKSKSNDVNITPETIITNIKSLTTFENFTHSNVSNINNNCSNLQLPLTDNIISTDTYKLYYSSGTNQVNTITDNDYKTHILDKIKFFDFNNSVDIFNYKYNPITFIDIEYNYKEKNKIQLHNFKYYNRFIYYQSYLFEKLLNKLRSINSDTTLIKKYDKYQNIFRTIQINYFNYQLNSVPDTNLKIAIDTDISSITRITDIDTFFTNIYNFINDYVITVNIKKFIALYTLINIATTNYYFISKLNINNNALTFTYNTDRTFTTYQSLYYPINIDTTFNNKQLIKTSMSATKLFNFTTTLYVLVPTKIIDNNYNEHYITSIDATPLTKITFTTGTTYSSITAYPKIYKFNTSTDKYTFSSSSDKINYTTSSAITIFKAPYILKESASSTDTTTFDNLKQIILSSLLYNLIHITSKYEYKELKKKLYFKSVAADLTINKVERVDYSSLFSTIDIATPININSNFLGEKQGYPVLIYNVYTYDKNRIIDIIEYFIYNIKSYNAGEYTETSKKHLNEKILSIRTEIDKTGDKTDLIKLYEKNRYIINLILKIYENLINYIKKEIETNVDGSLCNSTSATNMDIERNIYYHLDKYFTITGNNITIFSASKNNELTSTKENKIREIGITITNFFNICIFLLNNTNEDTNNIQDDNKETIISNFKFYNMDDTINLDISNLETIRKTLNINCDYYSKYNNLEKKQKLYMKINTDNVCYSFPILIIIFVVIFGETAFIKS